MRARFLAILLPLAACMAPAPAPEPTRAPEPGPPRATPVRGGPVDRAVALGAPFELAIGQTVEVQGTGQRIRFVSVEEDSRCPEGAQCASAGKARILLNVSGSGERPDVVELSTARGSTEAVHGGQTIRLLDLTPYPSTTRRIEPADRRARLVVGRL